VSVGVGVSVGWGVGVGVGEYLCSVLCITNLSWHQSAHLSGVARTFGRPSL